MRHIIAFGAVFLSWQSACAGDDAPQPSCGTESEEAARDIAFHVIQPLPKHIATGKPVSWVSAVAAQAEFVVGASTYEVEEQTMGLTPPAQAEVEMVSWTPRTGTVSLGRPPGVASAAIFYAGDVNAGGSVVVGKWWQVGGPNHVVRWTDTGGFEEISPPWPSQDFEQMSLSGDGSVAVIESYNGQGLARTFVWQGGQVYDIGLPGFPQSEIVYVRPDEPDFLGLASDTCCSYLAAAFRWTAAGGVVALGAPEGYTSGDLRVATIGADGLVAGGACLNAATGTRDPCLWSENNGWRVLTEIPPEKGGPLDLSPDGSTVVGVSALPDSQGWIWTLDGGVRNIELPGGGTVAGRFLRVSDGGVVVGNTEFQGKPTPFRWDGDSPAALLSSLPEHDESSVDDVSADGATALGGSYRRVDPMSADVADSDVVLWDDFGVHRLADVVGAPDTVQLSFAHMLHRNGNILFGDATVASYCDHGGPRGWVARRMR